MSIYDISHYGIRVILDEGYYGTPSPQTPLDVEGTVLQLITHGRTGEELYSQGRVIDLLCNYKYEGCADAYIRWDSDIKVWITGGTVMLRSAKYGHIKSIWEEDAVNYCDTPFHLLKPRTEVPIPKYFWDKGPNPFASVVATTDEPGITMNPAANTLTMEANADGTITYTNINGEQVKMAAGAIDMPSSADFEGQVGNHNTSIENLQIHPEPIDIPPPPPEPPQWRHHTISRDNHGTVVYTTGNSDEDDVLF